jgi:hypothetical protein
MTSAVQTLPIYTRLFVWLAAGALAAAIVATLLVPWLNRLAAVSAKENHSRHDAAAAPLARPST